MRLAVVRTLLVGLVLPLGLLMLVVAAFVEAAASIQRQAQAQTLPMVTVSCPSVVAAVGAEDVPGSVECTFAVSPPPQGGLTVRYEVTGVGSRSLGYQQSVVAAAASETDSIYYLSEATEITVRIVADSAYTVGSTSEATIAVGTSSLYTGAGLHVNEAEALDGYTLLTGAYHNQFYLIDNEGRKAYSWDSPGGLGKLLDSGNLITGHTGSNVNEISPNGDKAYEHATNDQHHDLIKLANGNFLFINSEYYSRADSIAAGADSACLGSRGLEVDSIVEIQPSGSTGGQVVWKWNVWDHLIQDHDSSKANYGTIKDHPELIDINYGVCQIRDGSNGFLKDPHHLTHLNSIDYNTSLKQILITSRHFSEVWVIDHSTTTQQAASSSGGDSDMGGNLLYRYGNPRTHDNGSKSDQRLFFPHNAHWIPSGLEGAGNVLIYNNGHEHPGFLRSYASADELALPSSGHTYLRAGSGFMQPTLLWSHRLAEHTWIMSNAQRLPNGNTLITEGNHARVSEVTPDGDVVWHYISPLARGDEIIEKGASPSGFGDTWVYRAYKYATNHAGIAALTLIPVAEREPLAPVPVNQCTVTVTSDDLVQLVRHYHDLNKSKSDYNQNWFRVLIAFAVETSDTLEPFTAAEATEAEKIWDGWTPILTELKRREAQCPSEATPVSNPPPPVTPVVSVSAGSDVTEGSAASFTLTANPAPAASLIVTVNVAASGDFGVTTGSRTVTIGTSGTATFTVSTTGDSTDEADGSVTATINTGTGYTVSSTSSTATVAAADDDDPPPPVTPVVSVSAGSDVTEGSAASFTLTANPAPAASLIVTVNVAASGDFGVTTGSRTVTIGTSGTATFTVSTTGDSTDEADGSVTATINTGTGYTVSSTSSIATVAINDDDDPPSPADAAVLSVGDVVVGEDEWFVLVSVRLSKPAANDVEFIFATAATGFGSGHATLGADVRWVGRSGKISKGQTQTRLSVTIRDDNRDEPDETFKIVLSDPEGAVIGDGEAIITIKDDD